MKKSELIKKLNSLKGDQEVKIRTFDKDERFNGCNTKFGSKNIFGDKDIIYIDTTIN